MEHAAFLRDLAFLMIAAGVVTIIFHRLKQPVVLGYIVAGLILGPHLLPDPPIEDEATIKTLSELGIIFLMFALGLEFSLRRLKEVGATAFIAAILEIVLMMVVGYEVGQFFGWSEMDSLFLGSILAISSSTIILKALEGLGRSREPFAQYVFGILIVEDILAIVMLALLSGVAITGGLEGVAVATTIGQLALFLVVVLVLGLIFVPRLLSYVASFKSDEMLLITVLALCFGVSLLAVEFHYSVALGAFLIGAIIAEARVIGRIENLMKPVRDMFSAIFFVSIGLLIDPKLLLEYAVPILVITVAVVVGKVVTCSLGTFIAGHSPQTSLRVGMSLAQIGEFSFIIATLGLTLGVTSSFLYPIAVTVSVLTTLLTPYLIKSADPTVAWFERTAPPRLLHGLDLYTAWVQRLTQTKDENIFVKSSKTLFWRIILNLFLISGALVMASLVADYWIDHWQQIPGGESSVRALCWLGAMILSLFLFVATYRKLDVLSVFMGEIASELGRDPKTSAAIKSFITLVVLWGGCAAIALLVMLLSVSLLPSWKILLSVVGLLALAVILFRERLTRVYLVGQQALEETFSAPKDHHDHGGAIPEPDDDDGISLQRIPIPIGHRSIGLSLAELNLTGKLGPVVSGIERSTHTVLHPIPTEQIQPDDVLLVLGAKDQIRHARSLLDLPTSEHA
jgi:CPA2 family monovalent cation:H+ antiporter-2